MHLGPGEGGIGNPHQPRAGGLRLGGNDGHLLPDQRIDQRTLARIGRAEDGNQAAVLCHPNLFMKASAAAVSASRRLVPVASASPTPCTLTATRKRAA